MVSHLEAKLGVSASAPELETREQAIHWLSRAGLTARKHGGWLPNAISVSRRVVHSADGQLLREDTLIIYPQAGQWLVARSLPGRRGLVERFSTLGQAAEYVLATLGGSPR